MNQDLSKNKLIEEPSSQVTNQENVFVFPTSFAQQRIWFLEQLEEEVALYNSPMALELRGSLDVTVLEGAMAEIVGRHEVLRTSFTIEDNSPVQVIAETLKIAISKVNLQNLSEEQQENQLKQLINQEISQGFDLAIPPLFRVTLIQLSPECHVLLFVIHHTIFDGWSREILLSELSTIYNAYLTNQSFSLPDLPIQYVDFTCWQKEWLTGSVLEKQVNYWQQQLQGIPSLLELPTDRSRPPKPSFQGSCYRFKVGKELTKDLKRLSQTSGVTLFMTLLTAFAILLHRYSGQEDIVVGSPIANRNRTEIEPLIGFFVNTLALRTKLDQNQTFVDLLAKVRQTTVDAYGHQDIPFERLVEALQLERNLSYAPVFQVVFALQNAPQTSLNFTGLTVTPLEIETTIVKYDLSLQMQETEGEIEGDFFYQKDLFNEDTVLRMAENFQTLLGSIVAHPQQRIGELPLLTQTRKQQLLKDWNNTQTEYPHDRFIHQLFEEQAAKTPSAVALVFAEKTLTYKELNIRANQLAHYLRSQGVKPETKIGICIEPSLEMIIGFLAILKAGGTYVPMDSKYPQERLQLILADAQVSLLLTQKSLADKFSSEETQIICLDSDWKNIPDQTEDNLDLELSSQQLAYVIYTSGSTGKPKGVAVPHRAVNRLVLNTNYVSLTSEDIIAQISNVAFDAATFEIWGALLNGACLTVVPRDIVLSPQKFAGFLHEKGITVVFITTALFNQIASLVPHAFEGLRYLLFGGESVDPKWVKTVMDNNPPENLLHVYGPTENTTFSSWYRIENVPVGATNIPIGRPIANTQIYLLDRNLQPVPIGIPGELYLGGDGLSRGYLNRPELNAEKFVPNPFGSSKLYKTGDLGRYLPDGQIEFLVRLDHQVKIRGFRIELGEIEAYLSQHSAVEETVIIATDNTLRDKRLVAYVVLKEQQTLETKELRLFLKEKLPEYMVPSAFVILDSLPLTPNGKVDRRALPIPEVFEQGLSDKIALPRDSVELQLTKIWEQVLGVSPIGLEDNFFDLGGHSLLAMRLISQIKTTMDKSISIASLFESPTIEQLANLLRQEGDNLADSSLVPLQPYGNKLPLFLVPPAGQTVMPFSPLAAHFKPDQPIYGLQYLGMDGQHNSPTTVEAMAAHFVEEVRRIQPEGPYYLAGKCSGGIVAYEIAQQLLSQGQEVAWLVMLDVLSPPRLKKRTLRYYLIEIVLLIWKILRDGELIEFIWIRLKMLRALLKYQNNLQDRLSQSPKFISEVYYIQSKARKKYITKPYPGKLTLILGKSNSKIGQKRQVSKWKKVVVNELDYRILPVDHVTMLEEPEVTIVADFLKSKLTEV